MPDPICIVVADDFSPTDAAALARSATATSIEVVFEAEELSSEAIAAFVDLLDDWLQSGRTVRLVNTPQMLAHTLYKVGRFDQSRLAMVSVRGTEPYAG